MSNRSALALGALATLLLPLPCLAQAEAAKPAGDQQPAVEAKPAAAETQPATGETGTPLSDKEKSMLERIRKMKAPRWRAFGPCRYDWGSWRLSEGGVRSTAVECGDPPVKAAVAVHCDTLRITRRAGDQAWEPWRLPLAQGESDQIGGEDLMVASLCANLQPTPAAKPAEPATTAKPAVPPEPGVSKPKPAPATKPATPSP